MSKQQGEQLLTIVNKIASDRLDPQLVMRKLNEIGAGVTNIQGELAVKRQQEEEADRIRRTAPVLNPTLIAQARDKVYLCIESKNLIPYKFRYYIVGSTNVVLGGLPIEMQTVYPKPSGQDWTNPLCIPKEIDLDSVREHYLRLRFYYQSLSYEELQLPGHAGKIGARYNIESNGTSFSLKLSEAPNYTDPDL
jgi:hypothetical protein